MGKPIVLSNLAMRFYTRDGWTREELDSCLAEGTLVEKDPNHPALHYYILEVGSRFDVEKLKPLVSKIITTFDDQPTDIDEAIKKYNW